MGPERKAPENFDASADWIGIGTLQWGRSERLRKTFSPSFCHWRHPRSFNGAGAKGSGKRIHSAWVDRPAEIASMGPERKAPENDE